jgi:hypothetical protein
MKVGLSKGAIDAPVLDMNVALTAVLLPDLVDDEVLLPSSRNQHIWDPGQA